MADNSYMTRPINSEGVAPLKDPRVIREQILKEQLFQRPVGELYHNIGRADRRTDTTIGDLSFVSPEELQTRRYANQSAINRLSRGLTNSLAIMGTTALDTILGTAFAAISGSWDNTVSRAFNDWQQNAIESNPIYRPTGYEQQAVKDQLTSSVFWGDFIQNTGFTTGMMLGTLPLMAANLPGALAVIAPAVLGSFSEARVEGLNTKDDFLKEREPLLMEEYNRRRMSARTPEELESVERWFANKYMELQTDANTVGNTTYGSNVALLMATNLAGWGSMFKRGADAAKGIVNNSLRKQGVRAVNKAGKTIRKGPGSLNIDEIAGLKQRGRALGIAKGIGQTLGEASSEAFEEVAQGIISDVSTHLPSVDDFTLSTYDFEQNNQLSDVVNVFNQSLKDAFQDNNTAIEALMGAFTSIIGIPSMQIKHRNSGKRGLGVTWGGGIMDLIEQQREARRTKNVVDSINAGFASGNTQNLLKNILRTRWFEDRKNRAIMEGDDFNIKNYDLGSLVSTVVGFDSIGGLGTLKNIVQSAQNMTDEELVETAKALQTPDGTSTFFKADGSADVESIKAKVNENAQTLTKIIDNYVADRQSLEASGVNADSSAANNYVFGKALIRDLADRKKQLSGELYETYKDFLEDEAVTLSKEDFIAALSTNSSFRKSLLTQLEVNPYLAPDDYDTIVSKILDLDKIDKAIESTSSELKKIWDSPESYIEDLLRKEQAAAERSLNEQLRTRVQPMFEQIVSSENPISEFVSLMEREDEPLTPREAAAIIDTLSQGDESQKSLADDLKKVYGISRDFIRAAEKAEISDDKIDSIFNALDTKGISTSADYTTAIQAAAATVLSSEELKKLNASKASMDRARAATDSGKEAPKAETSPEDGTLGGDRYDNMDKEALIKEAESRHRDAFTTKNGNKIPEFDFEDAAPGYHDYDEEDLRDALRQHDQKKINVVYKYEPKKRTAPVRTSPDGRPVDTEVSPTGEVTSTGASEEFTGPEGTSETLANREILGSHETGSGVRKADMDGTKDNESNASEDAFAVGRLGSPYDIAELKKHKVKTPEANPVINREYVKSHIVPFKSIKGNSYEITFAGGRYFVVVNINGVNVPFYLSTGLGGKKKVATGKWYPFFGISTGKTMWINKTTQEEINDFYDMPELREIAEVLNEMFPASEYSFSKSSAGIDQTGSKGEKVVPYNFLNFEETVNKDFNPTENTSGAYRIVHKNADVVRKAIDEEFHKKEDLNYGQRVVIESKTEEFINSGKLYSWIQERRRKKLPLTVGFAVIKEANNWASNNTIFVVIEHPEGSHTLYDAAGKAHKVQVLGVVSGTNSKLSRENFKEFKKAAIAESDSRRTPDGHISFKNLLSFTSELEFVFSGRFVKEDENHKKGNKNLLDIMPKDKKGNPDTSDVQIVVYVGGGRQPFTFGNDLNGTLVPLNDFNPNDRSGVVWLRVREGNGQIFHKYVKLKKFNLHEYPLDEKHINSDIYRTISDIVTSIVGNWGDPAAVKGALSSLHNYLQIPAERRIYVNTKNGQVRISGVGTADLTADNAAEQLMGLLYSADYRFNVGNGRLTKDQLINSDIFLTDLARLYNVGHSMLIKEVVQDEDGNWNTVESQDARNIQVHTGNKTFQKGKQFAYAEIDGVQYQKSDDGRYYIYNDGDRQEISDPRTQALIDLYFDIHSGRAKTDNFWKRKTQPLYSIDDPIGYNTIEVVVTPKGMHVLTQEESAEYHKTLRKNTVKEKKAVTFRVGNSYVPASKFGKTHYRSEPKGFVYRNDEGKLAFSTDPIDNPLLVFIEGKDGTYKIVPSYKSTGVLKNIANGSETFPELYDYEGIFEKGKIPVVRREAVTDSIPINNLSKGLIEWVELESIPDTLVRTSRREKSGKTEVNAWEALYGSRKDSSEEVENAEPAEEDSPTVEQVEGTEDTNPPVLDPMLKRRKSSPAASTPQQILAKQLYTEASDAGLDIIAIAKDLDITGKFSEGLAEILSSYSITIFEEVQKMRSNGASIAEVMEFIKNDYQCNQF